EDATDREIFEMCQGRFGLVDVIGENEETKNESEVEKRKLKEEEFADENKAGTSGARHGNDNDDVDYDGHCNDEDDVGHANHEDVHANVKEATEEKEANKVTKKKEEAKKLATEKKEKAKKLAAAKKKEAAEKSAKRLLK
nr:hypothetical protein [Tanacetum cinerariifolium]